MNVELSPEIEAYLRGLVDSGEFRSVEEALESALRLLRDADVPEVERSPEFRAGPARALARADRGETRSGDDVRERIRAALDRLRGAA